MKTVVAANGLTSYTDFVTTVRQLRADDSVFYHISQGQGIELTIFGYTRSGDSAVTLDVPLDSLPSTFSTDFPHAILLSSPFQDVSG